MRPIAHPKPCTYNLNGDCTWMRAYAMLRTEIGYLTHEDTQTTGLKRCVVLLDQYVADCLDMKATDVKRVVEQYTSHLGGGETSKGAEDGGAE